MNFILIYRTQSGFSTDTVFAQNLASAKEKILLKEPEAWKIDNITDLAVREVKAKVKAEYNFQGLK